MGGKLSKRQFVAVIVPMSKRTQSSREANGGCTEEHCDVGLGHEAPGWQGIDWCWEESMPSSSHAGVLAADRMYAWNVRDLEQFVAHHANPQPGSSLVGRSPAVRCTAANTGESR